MRGRLRGISGHHAERLRGPWAVAACAPGALQGPSALGGASLDWVTTNDATTAAAALREAGQWSLDSAPRRFDAEDWWFKTSFSAVPAAASEQVWLCFDGLATLAEVWLNGEPLLTSRGMFTAHELRVDALLRPENELVIRCRSLDAELGARRPRPRWRVPMAEHQQLRWFRTTLLGRTPGWSPPAAAVGPWRGVRLERRHGVMLEDVRIRADRDGHFALSAHLERLDDSAVTGVEIVLTRAGQETRGPLRLAADGGVSGELVVPAVVRWWPHTHGEPALYDARLVVRQGERETTVDLGAVGFRTVTVDTAEGDFAVRVNGEPVFCRGACWTPLDPVSFADAPAALDKAFALLVDGGMNMVRVGGTMVYESDAFLDRCDSYGVLLWQDLMFANFDYPEDAAFLEEVSTEARQQLARLQGRPCVAVLCGNSEGEQQAAMWGAERERWTPALFHEQLAVLARDACPDVLYWPSSAHGGDFPHQSSTGTSSYYGVGAYLRPPEDARRAELRFASECLAFANVPQDSSLARMPGGPGAKVHSAVWHTRAPRDLGAGWDFDDVRDHYVARLFGVDAAALRYGDHERYLELGRIATGEVMAGAFTEWRREGSSTRGALIWFLRDLWHGAGWGVVDAAGAPKPAWHALRRALAPVAIGITDEGGNGLAVQLMNDGPELLDADVELTLVRQGDVLVGAGRRRIEVGPRAARATNAAAFFDSFLDLSYAYRFGPPPHDAVVATLRDASGGVAGRAVHWIGGLPSVRALDVGLTATSLSHADGSATLTVRSRQLAAWVHPEVEGYESADDHFHLLPGEERVVTLRRVGPADSAASKPVRGHVRALNSETAAKVTVG